jgi:hypothetical protein
MSARTRLAARRERGTILFVALIVLVAMSLAGIALMRSVDTNVLIAVATSHSARARPPAATGASSPRARSAPRRANIDQPGDLLLGRTGSRTSTSSPTTRRSPTLGPPPARRTTSASSAEPRNT